MVTGGRHSFGTTSGVTLALPWGLHQIMPQGLFQVLLLSHYCGCDAIIFKFNIAVVLWSGCLGAWLRHLTRGQIDPRSWTDCKLYYFMFYYGMHYSSMLLVLMSVEKCFAVYFPLKSKTVCTIRTAKWTTGIVGIILAGYNILHFFDAESHFSKSYDRHVCIFVLDYWKIRYAVDSALYSFGPFVLMFITNFTIVFKFMRAMCTQNNSTESTNQALAKSATRGTVMVVTVSITFLILTAPTAVYMALPHVISLAKYPLYRAFMNLTQYLNHSINGLLYCIVGSRFRKQLFKLICRKERGEGLSVYPSVNNISVVTISGSRT